MLPTRKGLLLIGLSSTHMHSILFNVITSNKIVWLVLLSLIIFHQTKEQF